MNKELKAQFFDACWENKVIEIKKLFSPPFDSVLDSDCINHIPKVYQAGFIELADFLVYLPKVNESIREHLIQCAFLEACEQANMKIVNYIYDKESFKKYLNRNVIEAAFKRAYQNKKENTNEALSFLIMQANLQRENKTVKEVMDKTSPAWLGEGENAKHEICKILFTQQELSQKIRPKTTQDVKRKI